MDYKITVGGQQHTISIADRGDNSDITIGHPAKYFAPRVINQTQIYLQAIYDLVKGVVPLKGSVVELCGGIGTFPIILWDLLKPTKWTAYDIDPWCQENYQHPKAKFVLQDITTITPKQIKARLIFFDFPSITLTKLIRNTEKLKSVVETIVAADPEYMQITDVGSYWCHMPNHHPIYREYFDSVPTKDTYVDFMETYYYREFNRRLIAHTRGGGAGYYLFSR